MNKQELIDKAVHARKGVIGKENARAKFIVCEYGEFYALSDRYVRESGISSDEILCTTEEFQQRARELGYGAEAAEPDGWYCYETQKALRLPPVGVECLTWFDDGKECWQKCKVLALSPYEQDHMAVSLIGRHDRKLIWSQDFKPLDWNRKKYEAIEAASKCFQAHCMHDYSGQPFLDGLAGLYDAGFLRMPEDK